MPRTESLRRGNALLKLMLFTIPLAVVGGAIGFSGLLCPDGSCTITGSWYGGATVGGLIGYGLYSGFGSAPPLPDEPESHQDTAT